jgi:hypothetical protein
MRQPHGYPASRPVLDSLLQISRGAKARRCLLGAEEPLEVLRQVLRSDDTVSAENPEAFQGVSTCNYGAVISCK